MSESRDSLTIKYVYHHHHHPSHPTAGHRPPLSVSGLEPQFPRGPSAYCGLDTHTLTNTRPIELLHRRCRFPRDINMYINIINFPSDGRTLTAYRTCARARSGERWKPTSAGWRPLSKTRLRCCGSNSTARCLRSTKCPLVTRSLR